MSRGYGIKQRVILETLERHGAFYLASLAKTTTESKSYNRAAAKLEQSGKVQMIRYSMSMFHGSRENSTKIGGPKLVVLQVGADSDQLDRDELKKGYYQIQQSAEVENLDA